MKQKHKRENSIDVKPYSILFINMNTIYNTPQREDSRGLGLIWVDPNKERIILTNSPNLDNCQSISNIEVTNGKYYTW